MQTTWKRIVSPEGRVYRDDYTATIGRDGYQVRQFTPDIGRGDAYYASVRCEPIGDPEGYPTPGKAILTCLEHAGVADQAGRHFIDEGNNQIVDVAF